MTGDYINIHVHGQSLAQVGEAVGKIFSERGWDKVGNEPAPAVVDDEDKLPDGDDWYGVLVSGGTRGGWVGVYVDDWQDSGLVARELSQRLAAPVLEVWVAGDIHWGYTFFENGEVRDRFADDPALVAETPDEAALLQGHGPALASVLRVPAAEFDQTLRAARSDAGQFVGTPIGALAESVGLPFEHLLIGYESFFEDDPDDYASGLEHWNQWRHLAFRHPQGREQLAD